MMLSIIIPCFNNADTIGDQLDAFRNQQWDNPWEIIVSDNGSTDNSRDIVEEYKKLLKNLSVIDASDKRGAAHARNRGAQVANGTALAFCDADDVVGDGWVAAIGNALSRYDFVASKFETSILNNRDADNDGEVTQHYGLQEYTYPQFLSHSGGCGLGIKKSIHEAVGGFNEDMLRLEDTDYCWRVQLSGIKFHFIPEAVVHIRLRDNPIDLYRQTREWAEYNVLLYKKYRKYGMPKLPLKTGIKEWLSLIRKLPRIRRKNGRKAWLNKFHYRWGRLVGSIKYRVIAL